MFVVSNNSQRFSKHLRCPIVRKDKLDILGSRHVFIPANASQQGDGQPAEDAAGAGELESVFSCSMLPVEYYMEMVHSLSCIGIVDASPAQGLQTVLLKSLVFFNFIGKSCRRAPESSDVFSHSLSCNLRDGWTLQEA